MGSQSLSGCINYIYIYKGVVGAGLYKISVFQQRLLLNQPLLYSKDASGLDITSLNADRSPTGFGRAEPQLPAIVLPRTEDVSLCWGNLPKGDAPAPPLRSAQKRMFAQHAPVN